MFPSNDIIIYEVNNVYIFRHLIYSVFQIKCDIECRLVHKGRLFASTLISSTFNNY